MPQPLSALLHASRNLLIARQHYHHKPDTENRIKLEFAQGEYLRVRDRLDEDTQNAYADELALIDTAVEHDDLHAIHACADTHKIWVHPRLQAIKDIDRRIRTLESELADLRNQRDDMTYNLTQHGITQYRIATYLKRQQSSIFKWIHNARNHLNNKPAA